VGLTDVSIANLTRKSNEHLEKLVAAQERTNQLLEWLGGIIQAGIKEAQEAAPKG
jgi:hypothetical protein